MQARKKHRSRLTAIILLPFFLFSISACNSNGTSQLGDPGTALDAPTQQADGVDSSAACNNALFPIKQGATWMYISTGGPAGAMVYTNTITETHTGGFTLTTKFTEVTLTQQWNCLPTGLKALQIGSGMAGGVSIQSMTQGFAITGISGITLPNQVTPGMQWDYNLDIQGVVAMPGDSQTQSAGTYNSHMQEMGQETVTVPAGTYKAAKIQANTAINIAATFQGASVPITFNGISIMWYAPGVGFIKSVENGDFGGTAFNTTTELQSYTIP